MRRSGSKGQTTLEYAVLLAIVAGALIAMQVYLKRGIQGRIRDMADQISPTQYEQGRTASNYVTQQIGLTNQHYRDGTVSTNTVENVTREGNETVFPEAQGSN
jgi:Flp pilus assembly pilin Flp